MASERYIRVVHELPGRLRLRLSWLGREPDLAVSLADRLAECRGVIEVAIRPRTGSVLCTFDPEIIDAAGIVDAVQRHAQAATVLARGQSAPGPRRPVARSGSSMGHALADAFRGIDADVAAATDGRLDLGVIAALAFAGLGAGEVLFTRQLPAPPWFNLAWWAFRTFTMFEQAGDTAAATTARPPVAADPGSAAVLAAGEEPARSSH